MSILKMLVRFFSPRKKEKTYFVDWQIYDLNGNFFKWANSVITSRENPTHVFNEARRDILADLKLTGEAKVRARSFYEV